MKFPNASRLWNPAEGIRFALDPRNLYPVLDFSRFFGTASGEPDSTTGRENETVSSDQDGSDKSVKGQETSNDEEVGTGIEKKGEVLEQPDASEEVSSPLTSLEYKVSGTKFQEATASPDGSAGSFWSHTLYQRLQDDGSTQNVKVHYCTSKHTMEQVCKKYFSGEEVLGFDLEWMQYATRASGPRANVSLIQLASPGHIGLFHVAQFSKDEFVSETFREIMESSKITKVGVSIKADCTRLRTFLDVDTRGIFELSHLYKLVKYSQTRQTELINKKLVSLATQVKECLGLPLYKGDSVRISNWSYMLNRKQILYSAGDAYAGIQLFHVLEAKRKALTPTPPRPHHAELELPIQFAGLDLESESEGSEMAESDESEDGASIQGAKLTTTKEPAEDTRDKRVIDAEVKMKAYRFARADLAKATPAAMRAYFIWRDNTDLTPEDIAKLLRDPPLKVYTVNAYILEALTKEGFAFDYERLQKEIPQKVRPDFAYRKYRQIMEE